MGLIGAAAIAACTFNPSHALTQDGSGSIDASIDAPPIAPDAGPCMGASVECADVDTLRVCTMAGGQAMDTTCSWGCGTNGGSAHCELLSPSGGAALPSDTVGSDVGSAMLPDKAMLHLDNGQIDPGIRPATGPGVIANGIDFEVRNGVAVFRFGGLTLQGGVSFTVATQPAPPVVLVSTGSIVVDGLIDGQGGCMGGNGGPGGFPAGHGGDTAAGSGGGTGATDQTLGGGGGGYGAAGGSGGNAAQATTPAGGPAFGSDVISVLVGGGGGGGGNGGNPFGGGGGGAIQLVANGTITIDRTGAASGPGPVGSINAGGCGGTSGVKNNATDTGGGGGAGGTILIEAHDIMIKGALAVNGGGGGGALVNGMPNNGSNGGLVRQAALGSTMGSAAGGNGGWGGALAGVAGGSGAGAAGGGGGGVGRIRFNTRAGSATIDPMAILSPSLADVPTTCTQGVANTQ